MRSVALRRYSFTRSSNFFCSSSRRASATRSSGRSARGPVEHGDGLLDVAAGGGLARLHEYGALTLLADLRSQESHSDVVRLDGAGLSP